MAGVNQVIISFSRLKAEKAQFCCNSAIATFKEIVSFLTGPLLSNRMATYYSSAKMKPAAKAFAMVSMDCTIWQ